MEIVVSLSITLQETPLPLPLMRKIFFQNTLMVKKNFMFYLNGF